MNALERLESIVKAPRRRNPFGYDAPPMSDAELWLDIPNRAAAFHQHGG